MQRILLKRNKKPFKLKDMEVKGRIIAVLPAREGVSQRTGNEWKTQEYVLETDDRYPRKVCFSVFGAEKIDRFAIRNGEMLTVSFDIDASEYQGRWYNSIQAWKVERPAQSTQQSAASANVQQAAAMVQKAAGAAAVKKNEDDDLPF